MCRGFWNQVTCRLTLFSPCTRNCSAPCSPMHYSLHREGPGAPLATRPSCLNPGNAPGPAALERGRNHRGGPARKCRHGAGTAGRKAGLDGRRAFTAGRLRRNAMRPDHSASIQNSIRKSRQQRTAFEYGMVIFTFCAILLAIVLFARALHSHHVVENGLRPVSRHAALGGTPAFSQASGEHSLLRSGMTS